jgi:hypothetical protein
MLGNAVPEPFFEDFQDQAFEHVQAVLMVMSGMDPHMIESSMVSPVD